MWCCVELLLSVHRCGVVLNCCCLFTDVVLCWTVAVCGGDVVLNCCCLWRWCCVELLLSVEVMLCWTVAVCGGDVVLNCCCLWRWCCVELLLSMDMMLCWTVAVLGWFIVFNELLLSQDATTSVHGCDVVLNCCYPWNWWHVELFLTLHGCCVEILLSMSMTCAGVLDCCSPVSYTHLTLPTWP